MKRSRFLAAALALGGLLGAAEVRSASAENQKSLEAFRKTALQQRRAQGLEKNPAALYAKYPTPEVKLAPVPGGGSLLELPVGTEATLVATGRYVPGSFAHVNCVGVDVLSQKVTESRVEVRVRATSAALPGVCDLEVLSPVSLAYERVAALRVMGTLQWELATANGLKTKMRTSSQRGADQLNGSSEWFAKDGKALGTRQVKLDRTEDGFMVHLVRTQEEQQASGKVMAKAMQGEDSAAAQKELKAIQDKMQQECMKLPADKMGPCLKKYTTQMQAAGDKVRRSNDAALQQAESVVVGCQTMKLKVAGSTVSGRGTGCGTTDEVNVTGTVTVSK
jgi:hypothetical protein